MKKKAEGMQPFREFYPLVRDILRSREFRGMKRYRHHVKGNLYDHSVKVAYLCFLHRKRFAPQKEIAPLVRGAILHDFYLYELHGEAKTHKWHWFRHPSVALKNAVERYPDLSFAERDMIKHHMFPLTLVPPLTWDGWLVWWYDMVASFHDRFGKRRPRTARKDTKKAVGALP